jgi:hypothetical protein
MIMHAQLHNLVDSLVVVMHKSIDMFKIAEPHPIDRDGKATCLFHKRSGFWKQAHEVIHSERPITQFYQMQ